MIAAGKSVEGVRAALFDQMVAKGTGSDDAGERRFHRAGAGGADHGGEAPTLQTGKPIAAVRSRGMMLMVAEVALFILVVIGLVLACVVLGFVIKALWATIASCDIIIAGLQDKRAADAATSSKLRAEVATTGSASIAANTEAQAKLTDRMQAFADVVRPLGPDIKRAIASLDRNFDRLGDVEKAVGQGCRA